MKSRLNFPLPFFPTPWRMALLLSLLAVAAALLLPETSYAQEEPEYDYVNLLMLYEQAPDGNGSSVAYSVRNIGNATATGVTVSFLLEDLQAGEFLGSYVGGTRTSPTITDKRTEDNTNQRFTWEVGTILPGDTSPQLIFLTKLHPGRHSEVDTNWTGRVGVINATASSNSPEPDILSASNVVKVYSFAGGTSSTKHMKGNLLSLLLSVDNLRPDEGSAVNFDLTARNSNISQGVASDYINIISDINIKVELSDGLEFNTGWNPSGVTVASDRQSATWRPDPVDVLSDHPHELPLQRPDSREIEIQTKLTSGSLPLDERCITAWVEGSTPPPSPDYDLGNLKQCLGDDPPLLFEQGNLQAFTAYPCVDADGNDITSYPCGASDSTSEVAVIAVADSDAENLDPRLQEVGRSSDSKVVLLPEKGITVQVKDPSARVINGSTVTWQTGRKDGVGIKTVPGVLISRTSRDFVDATTGKECPHTGTNCRWSNLLEEVKVRGLTEGSNPPGGVRVIVNAKPLDLSWQLRFDAKSSNSYTSTRPTWDLGQYVSNYVDPNYLEFTTLGTHVIGYKAGVTRRSDSVVQEHTGTYTFHVGPIAELEVRDGGRNPAVSAVQRAYTITAVNNGPDMAPAAQVTLTGVPAGATVGSISEGDYDTATGVWTIGKLESAEYRRISGQREGATLTLLTGAAEGTEITATIANTQDYQVCIDSSGGDVAAASESACKPDATSTNTWHTTNYYDYNEGNSTDVTIAARPGSGGSALRTSQSTAGITLSWSPRSGAASYGIEVSEDGGATWRLLEPELVLRGTGYTHTGIPVGATRHYRVHAIDSEGRRGIPFTFANAVAGGGSREVSPPGAPEQMALSATPSSRTEILLSWVKPADYGSAITGYTLQVADGRNGPWANVDPQPGLDDVAYTYGGLQPNTRKHFRIRAANEFGGGLWSAVAEATTLVSGVPGPPRDVGGGPFGDNAISVFWNQPADDGHAPVTQYEAQWSPDGSAGWSRAGSTGETSLNHTGLVAGDTYYYRVRARNSVGWGPWSEPPASAVPLGELRPGPPYPHAERNGSTAMDIMWEPPYDEEWLEDTTITGYQLEWSPTGVEGTFRSLTSPSATSRSYTHTGLTPDTTYYYRMRARNSVGWGDWSETMWESTESTGVPSAPGLTAQANGATEVNLSWTKPASNGPPITDYELDYYDPGAQGWYWLTGDWVQPNITHYIDSGLEPGTERQYRIRANNDNGPGQWSTVRTVRTDAGGPDAPQGLSTAHDGEKRIVLSWDPPANDNGSSVTGYRIERSRYEDGPWERLSSNHRASPYTDSRDLYPGMTKYYRVAAMSGAGTGAWSSAVSGTTGVLPGNEAARAPDSPALLRFTSVGQDQVSFAWDRPASDGGAPITGYEYREAYGEDTTTTTGTSGTIRGLDDGFLYYSFEVRAVNAVGEGDWSESIYATLWPERSEQVRVSSTNITVNEGGTATFTVSLNRQPPLPVGLGLYPRGDGADALLGEAYQYLDKALIPSSWSHPDGYDWSDRAHNWSQGVPVSITIPDDDEDNPDRVMAIDVSVGLLSDFEIGVWGDEWNAKWGIDPERPCPGDPDSTCPTEWDTAPWRDFTGPSVKITVRDND